MPIFDVRKFSFLIRDYVLFRLPICCAAVLVFHDVLHLTKPSLSHFSIHFFPFILHGLCVLKRLFLHFLGVNSIPYSAHQEAEL